MLTTAVALSLALAASATPSIEKISRLDPDTFESSLSLNGIRSHLVAFSGFAAAEGGAATRAHGTSGYNASADYVANLAREAGLHVWRQAVSQELVEALVNVQIKNVMVPGDNVLAQTKWGSQEKVIMFGAHLDSVWAGPGINDNGSGSATLLELVTQLTNYNDATYAIRFSWWAAEERNLAGFRYYVEQLSQPERDQIVAYINLDMTGSPNYRLGVQDNKNILNAPWGPPVPSGSLAIDRILQASFEAIGQSSVPIPLSFSSDHVWFMENGIPSCYVASGASALKTVAEAELFGGVAGHPYDSCYHQICDNTENVLPEALMYNARAVARTLATLANDISDIEEEQSSQAE